MPIKVLTIKFARHVSHDTTMTYINTKKEGLYKELDDMTIDNLERMKHSLIND